MIFSRPKVNFLSSDYTHGPDYQCFNRTISAICNIKLTVAASFGGARGGSSETLSHVMTEIAQRAANHRTFQVRYNNRPWSTPLNLLSSPCTKGYILLVFKSYHKLGLGMSHNSSVLKKEEAI